MIHIGTHTFDLSFLPFAPTLIVLNSTSRCLVFLLWNFHKRGWVYKDLFAIRHPLRYYCCILYACLELYASAVCVLMSFN